MTVRFSSEALLPTLLPRLSTSIKRTALKLGYLIFDVRQLRELASSRSAVKVRELAVTLARVRKRRRGFLANEVVPLA